MTAMDKLTLLGMIVTGLTLVVALVTLVMWKTLPDTKKVWAIVVLMGWCGLLSMYPAVLAWVFGAPV